MVQKFIMCLSSSCVSSRRVCGDCNSQAVAALNGGSVAEQRALSCLTDQEHEVSTRRTSEGKLEDIFSVKYDLILLKLLFGATY